MPNTTRNILPVPSLTDTPNGPAQITALGNAVDALLVPIYAGTNSLDGTTVPSTAKLRIVKGSTLVTTANASGGFNFLYNFTFLKVISADIWPGDTAGNLVSLVPNGVNANSMGGVAYGAAGNLGDGVVIRVNYEIFGWIS